MLVLLISWITGFIVFAQLIPDTVMAPTIKTEAIVVLTGGTLRLETGIELLTKKQAKKLFVSGVHRGVDVRQLLRVSQRSPEAVECCISLGYDAD
ncbi:MAG: YdcF family protein, partial [Alphaproteobacteria bacterium]